jgi:hypothetical protein
MKTLVVILMSSFLILNAWTVKSQSFEPTPSLIEYNEGIRPCIALNIDPEPKTLKKAWIKYLKKEYNFKLKGNCLFGNNDLLSTKEVRIDQLSSKQMDFYTQIVEDENGSEMKVFASLGYDIYLNEQDYPAEFRMMNEMLVSFLKQYLPDYYKKDIDNSAKKVKELKKEITSLIADKKRNIEKIEKLTKDVEKYKVSVEDNSDKLIIAEEKLKYSEDKLERIRIKLQAL